MKKYYIYNNGDAYNHGCEAIIRSTASLLNLSKEQIGYSSFNIDGDLKYGIDTLCNLIDCKPGTIKYPSFRYYVIRLINRIGYNLSARIVFKKLCSLTEKYDVALSVGGDNYCYKGSFDNLEYINKRISSQTNFSVLWGVSIEPSLLTDKKVIKDLRRYNAIFCRESITYDALRKAGITNLFLYPDPAFTLPTQETTLPEGFISNNTIGINVSPLVSDLASDDIVFRNYKNLIEYIINNTDSSVALIPHVIWESNDDRTILNRLYQEFQSSGRIVLVEDANCMQLKWIISKCRMFIGTRTHATIAAYSTCVPTLVVGYSVKAKGIAKDLFGSYDGYVVSVQDMITKDDLTTAFKKLLDCEDDIRHQLKAIMPEYINRSKYAGYELQKMI